MAKEDKIPGFSRLQINLSRFYNELIGYNYFYHIKATLCA